MPDADFLAASIADLSLAIAVTVALFAAWFLTKRKHLLPVLSAIVVGFILVNIYSVRQLTARYEAGAQQVAVNQLVDVAQQLDGTLEARVVEARAIAAHTAANPGLTQAEYGHFLDRLLAQPELYTNLAAAPDMTIQYIYPEQGNELARGLFYPDVPSQWPMIQRAIATGNPVLIGPIQLVQGGAGFIIHHGMFDEQLETLGVVAGVLPLDGILNTSGILALAEQYRVRITAKSSHMSEPEPVWATEPAPDTDWATHTAELPNAHWQFTIAPQAPVTLPPGILYSVHLVTTLLMLGSVLVTVLLARSRQESRAARERLETTTYMLDEAQRIGGMGSWTMGIATDEFVLSPQLQNLLGTPDRIRLRDWRKLIPGPRGEEVMAALSDLHQKGGTILSLEHNLKTRNGLRTIQHTAELARSRNGSLDTFAVGTLIDISDKKKSEEQLEQLAYFDALTLTPNRYFFKRTLERTLQDHDNTQKSLALLHIDLDHFKDINDSLGHQVGDDVLRIVSRRIDSALKAEDTLARTGGDEFMVMLPNIGDSQTASDVAQRIISKLTRPLSVRSHEIFVGVSIGIALYPEHAKTYETMYQRADLALYRAKARGRGSYQVYAEHLAEDFNRRTALETALRTALDEQEFYLEYQPRIDLTTGQVRGMEALLRWNSARLGAVPPDEFIPVAEASGQILPLGRWVLNTAMTEFQAAQAELPDDVTLSINLSPRQIQSSDLMQDVLAALRATGFPAHRLDLEITETFIISDYEQCEAFMHRLSEHGVRFSLDDFGTGYSNLVSLRNLPLSSLKIDRTFVRDIATDANHRAIVQAIIQLGINLGMGLVAEGIEEADQRDILCQLGCHEGQGYWYARPEPLNAVIARWFTAPDA